MIARDSYHIPESIIREIEYKAGITPTQRRVMPTDATVIRWLTNRRVIERAVNAAELAAEHAAMQRVAKWARLPRR